MLRHKTTHGQCKIWWIYKNEWNNGPKLLRLHNCRAVLVMKVLCHNTEITEIYSVARERAEPWSSKTCELWKKQKRRHSVFHKTNLLEACTVHHCNTMLWDTQVVPRELGITYCSSKHWHTGIACLFHNWILTIGKCYWKGGRKLHVSRK